MTIVSFPGLGIGDTTLNPVLFTLFGKLEVRWYGILITLGIALAFVYTTWRAKKSEGIKPDDILDTGLLCVVLSIIGARLYYVLTTLEDYHSFGEAIAIWNGGLAVYGGVIGGALGIFIMCRIKKIKPLRFYDAVVPAVILAQAIGRWGNFFNGEAYGYPIAESTHFFFFLKDFTIPSGNGTLFHWLRMGLGNGVYYHPTFLYECIWNLAGFALLNLIYRKKKFDGQILLSYLAWYGFGRMFIEGLRTDSLYIFKGIFGTAGVRISQLVGLLCFLIGTALLIAIPISRKKRLAAAGAPATEEPTEEPTEAPEQTEQPEQPETDAATTEDQAGEEPAEEPPAEPAPEQKPAPKRRTATPRNKRPATVKIPPKSAKSEENDHADH